MSVELGRRVSWTAVIAIVLVACVVTPFGTYWMLRTDTTPSPGGQCADTAAVSIDVAALIDSVAPAVVGVRVSRDDSAGTPAFEGAASGFVVDTLGHIVTNQHVIEGATTIEVAFADGETVVAELVGFDFHADIAVLRVGRTDVTPLAVGESATLRLGEPVVIVSDWRAPEGGPSASLGIVSAVGRDIITSAGRGYTDLIQTDAAMGSGDSGGPMVDASGRAVGVVVAGSISGQCIGFAIPIDQAHPTIQAIITAAAQ